MQYSSRQTLLSATAWGDPEPTAGKVKIERSLEQTKAGLRFKEAKTKAGRRVVSIPQSIVAELRAHWRALQEQRLALGLGRAGEDDLVFAMPDGSAYPPNSLTSDWARTVRVLKLPIVISFAKALSR